jgi:hypothetical protein
MGNTVKTEEKAIVEYKGDTKVPIRLTEVGIETKEAKSKLIKLCECGCGKPVSIAEYTSKPRGYIKGQPVRFLPGHNAKLGQCAHPKVDWADLEYFYQKKKLSMAEIGRIKGCNPEAVRYQLKKRGIARRLAIEGQRLYYDNIGVGQHCPNWKGGRHRGNGYIYIYMPSHPYAQKHGYIAEHRLVIEQNLGRYLMPWEIVHHINGIRDDNRLENLELISLSNHTLREALCQQCMLRKEIRLLRWQIKDLTENLQYKFREEPNER